MLLTKWVLVRKVLSNSELSRQPMNQNLNQAGRKDGRDVVGLGLFILFLAILGVGIITGKWSEFHLSKILCLLVLTSVVRAHFRYTRMRCPTCDAYIKASQQANGTSLLFTCDRCEVTWKRKVSGTTTSGAEDMHID